jgi:hypothetical protein
MFKFKQRKSARKNLGEIKILGTFGALFKIELFIFLL